MATIPALTDRSEAERWREVRDEASGSFTFDTKLISGGDYQYGDATSGLVAGRGITYTLKFRVSSDVAGVCPGSGLHPQVDRRRARGPAAI
jgi:hypothetical protein